MAAKILVPIDFSPMTPMVVSWAASLARDRNASLILLHVQEPIADPYAGEMYIPMPVQENAGIHRALVQTAPADPHIHFEHRLVLGAASDLILKVAEEEQVELIVMGSHGRSWLGQILMGSVAEHVMRHATCPVLIVKQQCSTPADAKHRVEKAAPIAKPG